MMKLGVLLLTGALTLGLTACGGADEETKAPVDEAKTPQTEETTGDAVQGDVQEFTITGKNWDFASDKELVVKKGDNVKINLVNAEGVHTIANNDLGLDIKADAPGEFTADKAGEYEFICSTVCGAMEDHEAMKITLKVQE